MYYWLSIALVVLGLLVLAAVLTRTLVLLRRFDRAASMVAGHSHDRVGLLRARFAAVRVAVADRRGQPSTIDVNE